MNPVTVDIPHSLGTAEARRRIEHGRDSLVRHLPGGARVQSEWKGGQLEMNVVAMGQELRATVEPLEKVVRVQVVLPPALAFLRPMIEAGIQRGGAEMLQDQREP